MALSDQTPAQQRAMLAATIMRHEYLLRLRRREVDPRPGDETYLRKPALLDEIIDTTRVTMTQLRKLLKATVTA